MHKIIAVTGPGNSGKTGSICKFLADRGIVYRGSGDTTVVIRVRKAGTIHAVGVASGGDTVKTLKKNFDFLLARNCDIIICATKSAKSTIEYVRDIAKRIDVMLIEIQTNRVPGISQTAIIQKNARIAENIWKRVP